WVIAPIIRQIAYQIEFDNVSGIAEKWFPLGRQKHVVIDPRIAFGSPSIINRGIKTANIYDLYVAENNNLGRVCSWLEIEENEVLSAVGFEEQLMQAA
ncbi:MAG: DUF433 domain-containing protein, partial [Thermodesulfobacteriota bacterium]|nr:DUF433 domain-containing protein [Thermodesulfobacteriota bacterium]